MAKRLPGKLQHPLQKLLLRTYRRDFDAEDLIKELRHVSGKRWDGRFSLLMEIERVIRREPMLTPWGATQKALKDRTYTDESSRHEARKNLRKLYREWRAHLEMRGILIGQAIYKEALQELNSLKESPETPITLARIAELAELKPQRDIELRAMQERACAITDEEPGWPYAFPQPGTGAFLRAAQNRFVLDSVSEALHTHAPLATAIQLGKKLDQYTARGDRVVIDDVSSPHEAEAIRRRGGVILRINRPGVEGDPALAMDRMQAGVKVDLEMVNPPKGENETPEQKAARRAQRDAEVDRIVRIGVGIKTL
jgi:hypothetical protein